MRTIWRTVEGRLFFLVLSILAGCAGPTFSPDAAPEYLVTRARAPFYQLGPQQAAPPEQRLALDDRVRMLRREFGYSFTLLASGETGYVANDDLKPAPPLRSIEPTPRPSSPERAANAPENPPPVEEPLPKPDLQEAPADAPVQ